MISYQLGLKTQQSLIITLLVDSVLQAYRCSQQLGPIRIGKHAVSLSFTRPFSLTYRLKHKIDNNVCLRP